MKENIPRSHDGEVQVNPYIRFWVRLHGYLHRTDSTVQAKVSCMWFFFFLKICRSHSCFDETIFPALMTSHWGREKVIMQSLSTPRRIKWATCIYLLSPHKIPWSDWMESSAEANWRVTVLSFCRKRIISFINPFRPLGYHLLNCSQCAFFTPRK